ncbi:MAG: tetratricopeptide repeat protein [Methanosarcinaceae archaeon]
MEKKYEEGIKKLEKFLDALNELKEEKIEESFLSYYEGLTSYYLGFAYEKLGKERPSNESYSNSIKKFEDFLKSNSQPDNNKDFYYYYYRGLAFRYKNLCLEKIYVKNDPEILKEAINCFDESTKLKPNNCDTLYYKAIALRESKRYEKAIQTFKELLKNFPHNNFGVLFEIGYTYRENSIFYQKTPLFKEEENEEVKKLLEKSIACFEKTLQLPKNDREVFALYDRNLICRKNVRLNEDAHKESSFKKSIDDFEEALKLLTSKEEAEVYFYKGLALRESEKYEEAIEAFSESLKTQPNNDGTLFEKGLTYRNYACSTQSEKLFEKAIECFEKAINIKEEYHFFFYKALAHKELAPLDPSQESERNKEAIEAFDKAWNKNKKNLVPLFHKGICLNNNHKYKDAVNTFEEYTRIHDEGGCNQEEGSKKEDALFQKGLALRGLHRYEEALKAF